jgi:hypothetical protein
MRIQGVTGDLPAVVHLGPVAATVPVPAAEAPTPAVSAPSRGDDAEMRQHSGQDPRRAPAQPLSSFDPPLIAQRAALGWPVGPLVVERARATGTSVAEVWSQVDLARPVERAQHSA